MRVGDRNGAARKRAARNGLRLSIRGNISWLSDTTGRVVMTGDLADVGAYLASLADLRRTAVPAQWAAIIDDYMLTLAAAGHPVTTMKLRRSQLVTMARELGGTPAEVTAELLVTWFGGHTWAAETRRNYRAAVRGFFRWAYRTQRIPVYLADELPKVRAHPGVPRPAPDPVFAAAMAAADTRVRLMLRLAAEAGLRRAEIALIHSRDLTEGVDGAQLLVHGKGSRQRYVPLSDELASEVRAGAAGHTPGESARGWLFPGYFDGHLKPKWVGELCSRVLPDGYTLHTLRHRFSSRAYRGTRNLRAVQQLLGHSNLSVTERYVAVDDSEMRAAMMAAAAQ